MSKIITLKCLYEKIDAQIESFSQQTKITCVFGCGNCCTRFEPYISTLEALLVATHLHENSRDLQIFASAPSDKKEVLCPFYKPFLRFHCGIYKIRPLICRLFSFSAKKNGDVIEYQPCKIIASHYDREIVCANRIIREKLSLPTYSDCYRKLREIDPVLATDLHPLTRSIDIALEQYEQIISGEYREKLSKRQNTGELAIPFSVLVREHFDIARQVGN